MDDTPYINDGADTSLRKTVSLLNKIEAKTGQSGGSAGLTDTQLRASPVSVTESGQYVFGGFLFTSNPVVLQVANSNPNRVALLIYNDASTATAKVYVQYGLLNVSSSPPSAYAVVLSQKDYYEIPFFTGPVRVLMDAGSKINVTEITRTNSSSLLVHSYI